MNFRRPDPSFSSRRSSSRRLLKLLAAAALPVILAAPLTAYEPSRLAASNDAAVDPAISPESQAIINLSVQPSPLSNQDLLKKGVEELNNKQYEEALATLQQVQADAGWDDATKSTFADMLAKAEKGANERRAARAAFEQGETALAAGNSVEAIAQYRIAAENRFADEGTRAKAAEQIAVAENLARKASTDLKSVFASAKADFKSGQFADAKTKFEQLKAAGYRTGLFEKSVGDYLKETDARLAAGFTGTAKAADVVTPIPEKPAPQPTEVAVTPVPVTPEATAKAEDAYQQAAAVSNAADQKKQARDAYNMGRNQYRQGDWQAARENLILARNLNYKPGLFEDSPDKLIARMDAKEQADAARAAREAQASAEREAAAKAALEAEAALAAARAAEEAKAAEQLAAEAKAAEEAATAAAKAAEEAAKATPPAIAQVTPPTDVPAVTPPVEAPQVTTPPVASTTDVAIQATPVDTAAQELAKTAELTKVEAEQRAFQARELVTKADTAASAGNLDEALTLYSQAANLDPGNADAAAGRTRLMQQTNRVPGGEDLLNRQEAEIRARREAITYAFQNAVGRADAAISANNYRDARAALSEARIARTQDPTIFQQTEINGFDTTLAELATRLEASELAFTSAEKERAQAEAADAQAQKLILEAENRLRTVKTLKRTAIELTQQRKYQEALNVITQINQLDPNDEYALSMQLFLQDQAALQKQRRHREMADRQLTEVFIENEERKIPYNEILRYPENWPELSETRERSVEAERGASQEDQQVAGALERKLPEINLNNVAFSDVVDFLRDVGQTNIFVNWRALEGAGIAKDTQVTARLRDVKFNKVLTTILNEVGGGTVRLGYTIDEGVITISTEEDLSANVVTRVYDIRDLIINIPDFTEAPDFNLQQSAQVGGGGGGSSLFGGGGGGGGEDEAVTRTELVDQIIQLIQDTIASDSWKDNGGSVGSLRELQGQLIVTQTPENQRNLVRLLEQLRETRAIQVTIEARFLSVQRNFLEDIGLDVDFAFANLDEDKFFDPTNVTAANPNGTPGVIRVLQNSFGFNSALSLDTSLPGNLAVDVGGAGGIGSALSTGITFLDDFQVTALLRATQAAQSVTTVTAPRVTLFNGQRAYVLVSTQRAYVSDLTPIVGTGAVGFDPTPAIVNTGAILDVQATVSSDRKYVTLTLRPQVAQLLRLVNFQVAQATAGGGTGNNDDPTNNGVATGFIQQPEIQITEVRTTVSVPDGGTLLLGGQSLSAEIDREAGVPVLSKIPFLKRLFTNRSTAKDDQVLLILVKPTIIIQREQEAKQFPVLSQKAQ